MPASGILAAELKMRSVSLLSRIAQAALYLAAGANHFWHTDFYVAIMPPYIPWHLPLVLLSGAAEMGLGALLLVPRAARWAAWGLIGLLIAVFPANLHMALNAGLYPWAPPVLLWLRLPLQGVLIAWAYWHTRPEPGLSSPAPAAGRP